MKKKKARTDFRYDTGEARVPWAEDFPKARFVGFDSAHPIQNWLYDVVALKGKGDYHVVAGMHPAAEI